MENNIVKLVIEAIKNVSNDYIRIERADGGQQYRERVFCYELYHQMRQIQDDFCKSLIINGELDKRSYSGFNNKVPDFLFHVPGNNDNNEAIFEVKNTLENKDEIINDFKKIDKFINEHGYKIGIFLLYNHSFSDEKQKIKNILEKCEVKNKEKIFIITTKNPSEVECKVYSEILT